MSDSRSSSFLRTAGAGTSPPRTRLSLEDVHEAVDFLEPFLDHVRRRPTATAVTGAGGELTFAEVDRQSAALATRLTAGGAGYGTIVAVSFGRTVHSIVAVLGVLRAGAAYLPLDPGHPTAHRTRLLKRAGTRTVVTDHANAGRYSDVDCDLVVLQPDHGDPVHGTRCAERPAPPPGIPAYVLFTSGSTGEPKGVLMPRRALNNLVDWLTHEPTAAIRGAVLQFSALSWDTSTHEIFPTLCAGGCVVVASDRERQDPEALLDLLVRHRIERAILPPQLVHPLAELGPRAGGRSPVLVELMSGGDQLVLTPALRSWVAGLPACRLQNGYGPTETQIATVHTVRDIHRDPAVVPLGGAVARSRLYVLDPTLQPVRGTTPGELYISGPGLADGYLGAPADTASRFLPNPFGPPGSRMYRTGDMAAINADGTLQFLGRTDRQVKIRGHRVEPHEVEAALCDCPGVDRAAVIAVPGPAGPRLVAFVVAGEHTGVDLRRALAERLPAHELPSVIHHVGALPVNRNGKVDLARLEELATSADVDNGLPGALRPGLPAVTALRLAFAECLGLSDAVGADDDFSALGGDSLLAILLTQRLRRAGHRLSAADVLRVGTPRGLAGLVRPAATTGSSAAPGPTARLVPATPQQAEWYGLATPDRSHHLQAIVLRTPAEVRPAALRRAVTAVITAHPALRLTLREEPMDGRLHMRLPGHDQAVPDDVLEVARIPAVHDAELAAALLEQGAALRAGLDLHDGRLFRAAYLDRGPHLSGRLVLMAHQMAVDLPSWDVIAAELNDGYASALAGREPVVAPEDTSMDRWATALSDYAQRAAGAELDYWLEQASPTGALPVDPVAARSPAANLSGTNTTVTTVLDRPTTAALLRGGRNVNGLDIVLHALACTLAPVAGGDALRVDLLRPGRQESIGPGLDLARTVGWFTVAVPVRLSTRTPRSDLAGWRHAPHGGVGYGALRWLAPDAGARLPGTPRADISFAYVGRRRHEPSGPLTRGLVDADVGPFIHPGCERPYLIEVECAPVAGRMTVSWTFGGLMRRDVVNQWAQAHRLTTVDLVAALLTS